jgi:hypothetical protein
MLVSQLSVVQLSSTWYRLKALSFLYTFGFAELGTKKRKIDKEHKMSSIPKIALAKNKECSSKIRLLIVDGISRLGRANRTIFC